jgi:hypothetical protein
MGQIKPLTEIDNTILKSIVSARGKNSHNTSTPPGSRIAKVYQEAQVRGVSKSEYIHHLRQLIGSGIVVFVTTATIRSELLRKPKNKPYAKWDLNSIPEQYDFDEEVFYLDHSGRWMETRPSADERNFVIHTKARLYIKQEGLPIALQKDEQPYGTIVHIEDSRQVSITQIRS